MADETPKAAGRGVQALLDRLRLEGVAAGQAEAERILAEARAEARAILDQARQEAEALGERALAEAQAEREAAEQALRMAARDTVLALKGELTTQFSERVRAMVAAELRDESFLERLILELAGRSRPQGSEAEPMEIILPADFVGLEELRRHPESIREGTLTHFVVAQAREMLREGVRFSADDELEAGIRVRLEAQGVELDLSDRAVAQQLLRHLLPRFRALLDGIIH